MNMDQLEITVTQQDCDDGCRGNEHYCVVATAIGRLLRDANRIEININTIRFSMNDEYGKTIRYAYPTPPAVKVYIRDFDAGVEAKPIKFTLYKPQTAKKPPTPKGKAKTVSFKPQGAAKTHRSVRVFGEKSLQPVK